MYLIRNTTDRAIILDDLRTELGPNQQIDLEKVAPRYQIDASQKLKIAMSQKRVVVLSKDGGAAGGADASALREMEERLKADFAKQLRSAIKAVAGASPAPQVAPAADLSGVMEALKSVLDEVKNRPAVVQAPSAGQTTSQAADQQPSDDVLAKLHAKTMKRLEEKVTGHVEHEGKKVKDEKLAQNISELENLL